MSIKESVEYPLYSLLLLDIISLSLHSLNKVGFRCLSLSLYVCLDLYNFITDFDAVFRVPYPLGKNGNLLPTKIPLYVCLQAVSHKP